VFSVFVSVNQKFKSYEVVVGDHVLVHLQVVDGEDSIRI